MNSFQLLDNEDEIPSLENDEEITSDEEAEIEICRLEYNEFLDEYYSKLKREIESNENLSKNIIKLFLHIVSKSYDLINTMIVCLRKYRIENANQQIFEMDQKLNRFYKLMDKYRTAICSESGFSRMNRMDFLNEVDVYYNMFICTKNISYLFCALEYSPLDMLEIVDYMFFNDKQVNKRHRYETYLWILFEKQKTTGVKLMNEDDISRLYIICNRDSRFEKMFKELFI